MMDAARLVRSGPAREATVWLAWRPGDVEPRWVEVVTVPIAEGISLHAAQRDDFFGGVSVRRTQAVEVTRFHLAQTIVETMLLRDPVFKTRATYAAHNDLR